MFRFCLKINILISDCFVLVGGSPGNQINETPYANHISGVKDAKDCQEKHCQGTESCLYFTYNAEKKTCNLKTANAKPKLTEKDIVFGPRFCSGNLEHSS